MAVALQQLARIQQNGHRPVVDQRDLHVGTKLAAGNRGHARSTQQIVAAQVQRLGRFGRKRADERRPPALARIPQQGELRNS